MQVQEPWDALHTQLLKELLDILFRAGGSVGHLLHVISNLLQQRINLQWSQWMECTASIATTHQNLCLRRFWLWLDGIGLLRGWVCLWWGNAHFRKQRISHHRNGGHLIGEDWRSHQHREAGVSQHYNTTIGGTEGMDWVIPWGVCIGAGQPIREKLECWPPFCRWNCLDACSRIDVNCL